MSSKIKKGVACAIQALDGARARRSLISKFTDALAWGEAYHAQSKGWIFSYVPISRNR